MTPVRRLVLALVLLLSVLASSCNRDNAPSQPPMPGAQISGDAISFPKDSPQLSTLRVIEAVPERASFVRINGRTAWDESRTSRVTSPVAGRVVKLEVSAGSVVRKGTTLAIISSPEFGLAQAEARKAETDLLLTERSLSRARDLHGAGVIPLKELQASEAEFSRAQSERDRTEARQRLYGGGQRIDQQYELKAAMAGVVVERHITVGQEVRPDQGGDTPPLFVISDPAHLWLSLDIPEALTQEVQLGEAVRVSVPALPNAVFPARVDFIADYIDPQSRTVKARAEVDNRDRRLKSEMFVTADVEIPPSTALRVPSTALFLLERDYYAFVEEVPGKFVRRKLQAEEASLGYMRVTKGLHAGDKVVADGSLLLQRLLSQKSTAPDSKAPRADAAK